MSAERHALDAALAYSAKLERRIKELEQGIEEMYEKNNRILRQISDVKEAVAERDRPYNDGPKCEMSSPEAMQAQPCEPPECYEKADCPRCKNCGAPI